MAIDAAVESIGDGRLHPDLLGRVLVSLATPRWLKLNRLGEVLEGDLEELIVALVSEHQAKLLTEFGISE